ncbi:MAG: xanthine dehydrogenase family protein subunit M [Phycisphaerales bacterium]|nr:MAG: xanthine dehydrogenase family protein subunit M [Phycisphaerales bacterium]
MQACDRYQAPTTIEDLVRAAAEKKATLLAGGTDLLPRWSKGMVAGPERVIDLKRIEQLKGVSRVNGEVVIGACMTLSDIADDSVICETAPVLAEAAGRVACPQVRNRATIGGNLCNASPAADTAIPLILLDAVLELAASGPGGLTTRELPITEFFRGPGATALRPGEILTRVRFRPLPAGACAAWDKFGTRPSMEIAVASVGLALELENETVTWARVGYGSVAPTPLRGRAAEAALMNNILSTEVIARCQIAARKEISPISDVRAGEAYRREIVGVMLRRMLEHAASA